MSSYFLTTERLGLRCWSPDDLSLAMNLWGDPKVMAMIDVRGQLSSAEVQEILDKHIATQRTFSVQYWPMFVLNTGEHAGCCGLRPYTAAERTFELGAHIVPRFWRQGYALEAATAVIAHAFRRLGAAQLVAGHNPNNVASRALLEKLGFQQTHVEFYAPTGLMHPTYRLTLADFNQMDQ